MSRIEETGLTVHSDKKRKPRYWVTKGKQIVFENDWASVAIQWAIDNSVGTIGIDGVMELKSGENIRGIGTLVKKKGFR